MFKITLNDVRCSPICDGTTFWFVENLEEFEKNWLPLAAKQGVSTIERYYRSKLGEVVTDYYSDDPDLNIVQEADSEVLCEKEYLFKDKKVELLNTYRFISHVEFDQLSIRLRVMRYADQYYLVGRYMGTGCKRCDPTYNRWYDKDMKYSQMHFYGNPIANYRKRDINWDDWDSEDAYKDFYTDDKDFYKHEEVEAFVWIPIKVVKKDYKIRALSKTELATLMGDIVGEAG